jgi:hypothetical protein
MKLKNEGVEFRVFCRIECVLRGEKAAYVEYQVGNFALELFEILNMLALWKNQEQVP